MTVLANVTGYIYMCYLIVVLFAHFYPMGRYENGDAIYYATELDLPHFQLISGGNNIMQSQLRKGQLCY